jgi:serine/threonine protein kinase
MLHPFQTTTHAKRTYRELKLLMYLNHPDAQVCTNNFFVFFEHRPYLFCIGHTIVQCVYTWCKRCRISNVVCYLKYFSPLMILFFSLIYRSFVFNFVDYDLHRVIKRRLPFSEDHIRQIIYSLLRGLKVCDHSFSPCPVLTINLYNILLFVFSSCIQVVFFIV